VIVHDVLQGTTEWHRVRAGIPTASCFDQIITPKTGKPSSASEGYLHRLLAERILGRPIEQQSFSGWMDRGNAMEADAVAFYESQRELDTVRVGFITNDAGAIGASPDRLVGEAGLLEIKCPSEAVHMGYLLNRSLGEKHRPQVQGQLWVTGRSWSDTLSYHPELPPALIRVERDEEYIALLSGAVEAFVVVLGIATDVARRNGWIKEKR
jgi:hypothetical protein